MYITIFFSDLQLEYYTGIVEMYTICSLEVCVQRGAQPLLISVSKDPNHPTVLGDVEIINSFHLLILDLFGCRQNILEAYKQHITKLL